MDIDTCRRKLMRLSKKELISKAKARGHCVDTSFCKAKLVDLIMQRKISSEQSNTCRQNLMKLGIRELKSKAKADGHRGYSYLNKAELIEFLLLGKKSSDEIEEVVDIPLEKLQARSTQRKDLLKMCKKREIKYVGYMTEQEMIEVLRWNHEDPSVTVHPDTEKKVDAYLSGSPEQGSSDEKLEARSTRKDLLKICKERKIKYATNMANDEMIEVLKWNDEDPSVNVHPDAQKRVVERRNKYRDNPEQKEKARECTRRWRINNPEKAKEHWKKWQHNLFGEDTS